jgi:hypothetical protein
MGVLLGTGCNGPDVRFCTLASNLANKGASAEGRDPACRHAETALGTIHAVVRVARQDTVVRGGKGH